jgi:hypothetical protein
VLKDRETARNSPLLWDFAMTQFAANGGCPCNVLYSIILVIAVLIEIDSLHDLSEVVAAVLPVITQCLDYPVAFPSISAFILAVATREYRLIEDFFGSSTAGFIQTWMEIAASRELAVFLQRFRAEMCEEDISRLVARIIERQSEEQEVDAFTSSEAVFREIPTLALEIFEGAPIK